MSRTKAKLAKFEQQNRDKEARGNAPPEEEAVVAEVMPTSFYLPQTLIEELHTTKLHLQLQTKDRRTHSTSALVRAAIRDFVRLEMDEQIASVRAYVRQAEKASG